MMLTIMAIKKWKKVILLVARQIANLNEADKVKVTQLVRFFATPWTIQPMLFSRPEYWSG